MVKVVTFCWSIMTRSLIYKVWNSGLQNIGMQINVCIVLCLRHIVYFNADSGVCIN